MLYHLPFDEVEFNQMSGRAGRDGRPAWVHLAYGVADARINERILARDAPARDDLATLYRVLMGRSRAARLSGERDFVATNADLAGDCIVSNARCAIDDHAVSCGISIFRELGFVRTTGFGGARRIEMVSSPEHMDLTQSIPAISRGSVLRRGPHTTGTGPLARLPTRCASASVRPIVPRDLQGEALR